MEELTKKQKELCLERAVGHVLFEWEGTAAQALERMEKAMKKNFMNDIQSLEKKLKIRACDTYQYYVLDTLIEVIGGRVPKWCGFAQGFRGTGIIRGSPFLWFWS